MEVRNSSSSSHEKRKLFYKAQLLRDKLSGLKPLCEMCMKKKEKNEVSHLCAEIRNTVSCGKNEFELTPAQTWSDLLPHVQGRTMFSELPTTDALEKKKPLSGIDANGKPHKCKEK